MDGFYTENGIGFSIFSYIIKTFPFAQLCVLAFWPALLNHPFISSATIDAADPPARQTPFWRLVTGPLTRQYPFPWDVLFAAVGVFSACFLELLAGSPLASRCHLRCDAVCVAMTLALVPQRRVWTTLLVGFDLSCITILNNSQWLLAVSGD